MEYTEKSLSSRIEEFRDDKNILKAYNNGKKSKALGEKRIERLPMPKTLHVLRMAYELGYDSEENYTDKQLLEIVREFDEIMFPDSVKEAINIFKNMK